ncbi:MAG: hypothetical protein RI972_639, partial [Pseudomonadota bacterium]
MPLPKPPVRKATLLAPADYPTVAQKPQAHPVALPPAPRPVELRVLPAAPQSSKAQAATPAPAVASPLLGTGSVTRSNPPTPSEAPSAPAGPMARQGEAQGAAKRGRPNAASEATAPVKAERGGRAKKAGKAPVATKLFVLDTNVLMHDPMSIFRFEEHDVFLPMIT